MDSHKTLLRSLLNDALGLTPDPADQQTDSMTSILKPIVLPGVAKRKPGIQSLESVATGFLLAQE